MATRSTDTEVVYEDPSQYLSASISSLSSQRAQTSWVAKTYRHATQLFLTRRLCEAYETVIPLVDSANDDQRRASPTGLDHSNSDHQLAPVATSSKGTRVKIWSFYLTLLDAIVQLGPEEGKLTFGGPRWKSIADQVREGSIWDFVVRSGYRDLEGTVDGEVIANLSTLLLSHMPSQKFNQQKLESYLAASAIPVFDITAHMAASQESRPDMHRSRSTGGTSTPRDLNTRLKLIELYTLHVLPRNEHWDYAKEFISMSEVLDDERREAFQHALQTLREEQSHEALRQAELKKQQAVQAERERQLVQDKRQAIAARRAIEDQRAQKDDDHDEEVQSSIRRPRPQTRQRASTTGSSISAREKKTPRSSVKTPSSQASHSKRAAQSDALSSTPQTFYHKTVTMLSVVRTYLAQAREMRMPASLLRMLLFILAFAFALARRDVRETMRRMTQLTLQKLKETAGMGLRVSYV